MYVYIYTYMLLHVYVYMKPSINSALDGRLIGSQVGGSLVARAGRRLVGPHDVAELARSSWLCLRQQLRTLVTKVRQ